jgi:hypothetical protein
MRCVLALIVIVYLVGVGVELSPTFSSAWHSSASELIASVWRELPAALEWPATVYHRFMERP